MADFIENIATVDEGEVIDKAKNIWNKYGKMILYVLAAVLLITLAIVAYRNFISGPKEEKSADAIYPAEQIFDKLAQTGFNKDSINLILNGGNGLTGVLKIASNYSGTNAGNRAEYIAGACFLHSGDFSNAIKHLKEFSTPATQIQTAAYWMLGDASAELKKNDDALDYYKKASSLNTKDEFMTAESLYKAGTYAETIGKSKDAIDLFQKIKSDFPKSSHAAEMDKHLARLGITN